MNVIELETERQKREQTDSAAQNRDGRNILKSMWYGIEHCRWSKDPNDPDAEPSLERFMVRACDESPMTMLKMLSKFYEPPKD
jgi:hypothetical protein